MSNLQKISEKLQKFGFKKSRNWQIIFGLERKIEFTNKKYGNITIDYWENIENPSLFSISINYRGDSILNSSDKYEDRMKEVELLNKLFKSLKRCYKVK